jgi:hypothetical protein
MRAARLADREAHGKRQDPNRIVSRSAAARADGTTSRINPDAAPRPWPAHRLMSAGVRSSARPSQYRSSLCRIAFASSSATSENRAIEEQSLMLSGKPKIARSDPPSTASTVWCRGSGAARAPRGRDGRAPRRAGWCRRTPPLRSGPSRGATERHSTEQSHRCGRGQPIAWRRRKDRQHAHACA